MLIMVVFEGFLLVNCGLLFSPEDGASMFLQNAGELLPDCTLSHPMQYSSNKEYIGYMISILQGHTNLLSLDLVENLKTESSRCSGKLTVVPNRYAQNSEFCT
jgi:hypothetical protein